MTSLMIGMMPLCRADSPAPEPDPLMLLVVDPSAMMPEPARDLGEMESFDYLSRLMLIADTHGAERASQVADILIKHNVAKGTSVFELFKKAVAGMDSQEKLNALSMAKSKTEATGGTFAYSASGNGMASLARLLLNHTHSLGPDKVAAIARDLSRLYSEDIYFRQMAAALETPRCLGTL